MIVLHANNGIIDILGAFVGNYEDAAEAYYAGQPIEQWCTLQAIPQIQPGEWEIAP